MLLLSGCAQHRGPVAPAPEAEVCTSLQNVIAQADVRFEKLKRTPTMDPLTGVTKWETKPVFSDSQCDVVEWGGGRINFICIWPDGSEAQARQTYQQNVALMGRCLGTSWPQSESRGQTGEAMLFRKSGDATHVVMRYFKPRSGYRPAWETSLTIGDEVTPDAR